MTFAKGQSGNPGGRAKALLPDGQSVQDLAREHTADAIDTLAKVMSDGTAPQSAKVAAAEALLSRGWGRPTQSIDLEVRDDTGAASLLESARRRAAAVILN